MLPTIHQADFIKLPQSTNSMYVKWYEITVYLSVHLWCLIPISRFHPDIQYYTKFHSPLICPSIHLDEIPQSSHPSIQPSIHFICYTKSHDLSIHPPNIISNHTIHTILDQYLIHLKFHSYFHLSRVSSAHPTRIRANYTKLVHYPFISVSAKLAPPTIPSFLCFCQPGHMCLFVCVCARVYIIYVSILYAVHNIKPCVCVCMCV